MEDTNLHETLTGRTSTWEQPSLHSSAYKQFNANILNRKVSFKDWMQWWDPTSVKIDVFLCLSICVHWPLNRGSDASPRACETVPLFAFSLTFSNRHQFQLASQGISALAKQNIGSRKKTNIPLMHTTIFLAWSCWECASTSDISIKQLMSTVK